MLVNINYKGHINESVDHLEFSYSSPRQCVIKTKRFSLILFPNGKCRLMGCKEPLTNCIEFVENLIIFVDCIQSITVTHNLGQYMNLYQLAKRMDCWFEPEIFPALRVQEFNPLCVNVFASGKIVILGLKTLDFHEYVNEITLKILSNIQ